MAAAGCGDLREVMSLDTPQAAVVQTQASAYATAIATVPGAIGRGSAGNAMENNVRKTTVYQIRVRMQDGSTRTIQLSHPIAAGSQVTVDGGNLRTTS